MSADESLARLLGELTETGDFKAGRMRLGAGDDPSTKAMLLKAIDATMLSRALVLRAGDTELVLSAGGRRLRGLIGGGDGLEIPDGLVNTAVSRDDVDIIAQIGELVDRLLALGGPISLERTTKGNQGFAQSDTGASIARLEDIWSVDMDAKPLSLLDQILINGAEWIVAAMEAKTKKLAGDAVLSAEMARYVSEHWAGLQESVSTRLDEEHLVALDGRLTDNMQLVSVKAEQKHMFIAVRRDGVPAIFRTWAAKQS